jgi:Na+/proline symporter
MDGRVGFMVGNVVKRICTIAWSLTALAAVAWYLRRGVALEGVEPDHVYGDVARAFLPALMPGLLGVFLACLVAAVMSSCDAMMVSSSALVTKNVYKPLVPNRPDRHYVLVGRLASVIVVAGGIAFAYWVPDVVTALKIWFRIAPMMGIAFWLGLFWRRATATGAWAVTLTGFGCWFLTTRRFFVDLVARLPLAEELNFIWREPGQQAEIYQPWSILFYIAAALAAGVIASLLSRPVAKDRLDRFYTLTRTPIVPGEEVTEPCALPDGVEPARRPMLFTGLGLEIPKPSRTSVIGFLAGWLAVAALVGGFLLIVGD